MQRKDPKKLKNKRMDESGPTKLNPILYSNDMINYLNMRANEKARIIKEIETLMSGLLLDWESKSYILGYLQVKSK